VSRSIGAFADWTQPAARYELYGGESGLRQGPRAPPCAIGEIAVAFDARIDNLGDLCATLRLNPKPSLSELLLSAYRAWGESFVDHLRGDFAVILWDSQLGRLLAARDPFGVRPLFFLQRDSRIWLASEVSTILEMSGGQTAVNRQRVVEYLVGSYKSPDATFFRDVRELPPGHTLTTTGSRTDVRRYWFPPSRQLNVAATDREDCHRRFRELFLQSVRRRLATDGPTAIHVSGGLDSSSIAGAANHLIGTLGWPGSAAVGVAGIYPGLACDERGFIGAVARHVRFPIEEWDAGDSDPIDLLDPLRSEPGGRITQRGGTMGDIALAHKHGSGVILSGVGGDEIGMVTGIVKDMIANGDLTGAIKEMLFFPDATLRSRAWRLKRLALQFAPESFLELDARVRADVPDWLAPDLRKTAREVAVPERSQISFSSQVQRSIWSRVASVQTARVVGRLQQQALSNGVEYRFPFLDRDLVDFVLAIPYEHWPRIAPFARLHREPLADLLPPEVTQRIGKAEFTPALANRCRRAEMVIRGLVGAGPWASVRYVDLERARRLCAALFDQDARVAPSGWARLWNIAALEAWLRMNSALQFAV
jgi:asparagine synthase (glutamine-hydrolysing)